MDMDITFGNLLTMISLFAGTIIGGIGIYMRLGKRIDNNEKENTKMCLMFKNLKERVDGQGGARETAFKALRSEIHERSIFVNDAIEKRGVLISELFTHRDNMNGTLQKVEAKLDAHLQP